MEKTLTRMSPPTWRNGQQLLNLLGWLGWRALLQGLIVALWIAERAESLWVEARRKIPDPKIYPSHRACPACGESTVYRASWSTFFTGLYTRTCCACSYCEPRKVKMIRQL